MLQNKAPSIRLSTLRAFCILVLPIALLFLVGCTAKTPVYDSQFGETLQAAKDAQRIQSGRQAKTIDPQVGSNEMKGAFDSYVKGGVSVSPTPTTATSPSSVK